jgi:hypothetical protein
MVKKVEKQEGTVTVSKTILKQTTQKQEKIEIRPFVTDATASVGIRLDRTLNIGNFESIKLGVSLTVPCYMEEVVDVFHQTIKLTKELMEEQLEKLEA